MWPDSGKFLETTGRLGPCFVDFLIFWKRFFLGQMELMVATRFHHGNGQDFRSSWKILEQCPRFDEEFPVNRKTFHLWWDFPRFFLESQRTQWLNHPFIGGILYCLPLHPAIQHNHHVVCHGPMPGINDKNMGPYVTLQPRDDRQFSMGWLWR